MSKKLIKILTLVLTCVFTLAMVFAVGCKEPEVKVDNFTLNYESKVINVGESFILTISESKYEGKVQFSSENSNVAIVSANGTVTGIGEGQTKICAYLGNYSTYCNVVVNAAEQGNTNSFNVVLNQTTTNLKVGGIFDLTAVVYDEQTLTQNTVEWSVSDQSKISLVVDSENANKATITSLACGSANVVATYGEFSAKCTVTITNNVDFVFDKDNGKEDAKISKNEIKNITPTIYVNSQIESDAELIFTSSDETITTVDEDGNITGVGFGDAIIYITYGESVFEYSVEVFDRIISTGISKLVFDENDNGSYSFTMTQEELNRLDYPLSISDITSIIDAKTDATYAVTVSSNNISVNGLPGGESEYYIYNGTTKFSVKICVATTIIRNYKDLIAFRNEVSKGANGTTLKHVLIDEYVVLANDIDFAGNDYTIPTYGNVFGGVLDGRGYEIKNVKFVSGGLLQGLSGTVKNIGLSFTANTQEHFGAIATELRKSDDLGLNGLIEDVFVQGELTTTASMNVGGLVSKTYAGTTIRNSFVSMQFNYSVSNKPIMGAIAAISQGIISNCFAVSNVQAISSSVGTDKKSVKTNYAEFIEANVSLDGYGDAWDTSCGVPLLVNYCKNIPEIEIENTETEITEEFNIKANHDRVFYSIVGETEGVAIDNDGRVTFTAKVPFTFTVKVASIYDSTNYDTMDFDYAGGLVVNMADQNSLFELNKNDVSNYVWDISSFEYYESTFNVTSVTIGNYVASTATYENGKITLPNNVKGELELGELLVVVTTSAEITYKFKVTVYNEVVVTTKAQFIELFNGLYAMGKSNENAPIKITLGADIIFSDSDSALQRKGTFNFYGSLDGQGYAIKNLKIDSKTVASGGGLFSDLYGDVKNVAFINVTVDNGGHGNAVAAICATLQVGFTISNVFISGNVLSTTSNNVGGIAWKNQGSIKNCIVALETDNTTAYTCAGTRIGSVSKCYAISSTYKFLAVDQGTTCSADAVAFFNKVVVLDASEGWNSLWKIENGTLSFGNNAVLSR